MELKVGDKIKYDSESLMFSSYGIVEKVCPKSIIIWDSESEITLRIKKNQIAKIY